MQRFADDTMGYLGSRRRWLSVPSPFDKRTVRSSRGAWSLSVVVVVGVLVIARPLSTSSVHDKIWVLSPTLSVVTLTFVVLGAVFAVWARLTIGTNWSGVVTVKEDHELIQRGPYHLARYPLLGSLAHGSGQCAGL